MLTNRSLAKIRVGMYKQAEADATAALAADPSFHKAHHRRAVARKHLGKFEDAKADFAKVGTRLSLPLLPPRRSFGR